ncbi:unnamed protein product, partial [Symbiodinium microadriaticum]
MAPQPCELPEALQEELEILRAIYGDETVRLLTEKRIQDDGEEHWQSGQRHLVPNGAPLECTFKEPICCLEVDLEPMSEEGFQLVWVTLLVTVPKGYPLSATPKIEVDKSRGIGDAATGAMMDAARRRAKKGIDHHGLQVKDALGKTVSECSICMDECDPGSAIFVACNCVFHRHCIEEWRALKDEEKRKKADAATESIKSQRDALEKQCEEADSQVEEQDKQDRAASVVEQAMKKAQAAANDDEPEPSEPENGEEEEGDESDSSVEPDVIDYRNEARWGAPEVSLGGLYQNKHTKKNWHPSVRMNRKRPKKYLKRIDEKLEEMKKEGKRQLSEEMSQAVTKWEKAQFEHKEAKLVLDKEVETFKKLKERSEKLVGELEWVSNYLGEERAKFTSLPLLCPVCQNEVDAKVEAVTEVLPTPGEGAGSNEEEIRDSAEQDEAARRAREAAEEEELKRQKAQAELAEREEKLLFMPRAQEFRVTFAGRMTKGAAGKLLGWERLQPPKPEDTDVAEGDEGSSASARGDDTEDIERVVSLLAQRAQRSTSVRRGGRRSGYSACRGGVRAKLMPLPLADKIALGFEEALDDELLNTIELLMEAYSAKEVEGRELLEEPFSELLEVLRGSEKPTDLEIKEVLVEMMGIIEETMPGPANDTAAVLRKQVPGKEQRLPQGWLWAVSELLGGPGKPSKSGKGGKGGSRGSKGVLKKGKLKPEPGKGSGKSKAKGGGKDASTKEGGKGSAEDGKGKGKGKGRGSLPPGAPKMTRKERKKAAVSRAKGLPAPAAATPAPKPAPVLGQAKKKGKKRLRPGQAKRNAASEGPAGKALKQDQEEPAKKRVRARKRGTQGEKQAPEAEPPRCKKGHTMGQRTDNPPAYKNEACCDVCGREHLAKLCIKQKLTHYFHCSFCRFDICPNCAKTWSPEEERRKARDIKWGKVQAAPKAAPVQSPPGTKARRQIWIPSEADAVSRAPLRSDLVS